MSKRELVRDLPAARERVERLLHSPPVAQGWLGYLTAIRQQASLPGALVLWPAS